MNDLLTKCCIIGDCISNDNNILTKKLFHALLDCAMLGVNIFYCEMKSEFDKQCYNMIYFLKQYFPNIQHQKVSNVTKQLIDNCKIIIYSTKCNSKKQDEIINYAINQKVINYRI